MWMNAYMCHVADNTGEIPGKTVLRFCGREQVNRVAQRDFRCHFGSRADGRCHSNTQRKIAAVSTITSPLQRARAELLE